MKKDKLQTTRKIELLAPAKNLECGIEAIKHGADAVYIGAPMFGARAAAGNSIDDIKQLCEYAHLYNSHVYVALNTILNDSELEEARLLAWELYNTAHIDALIVQDMGLMMLDLPPVALHASTQMDNRTPAKAKFLEDAGFRQIVLARELSIDEIREATKGISVPIEYFVHGALCVSYSGQCYLSQALSKRSANKGSCAQYCRLPYTLVDDDEEKIVIEKHLLSMKDLNLSENLEELMDAGVSSLKIEGRLKDVSYVKNVVAYYRKKIDEILERRVEYTRLSDGVSTCSFEPQLDKSFNRGFTKYFAENRTKNIWSVDSPKSIGEYIGLVSEVKNYYLTLDTTTELSNGDGLCFMNNHGHLEGLHVNKADGKKIFPHVMPNLIKIGTKLYRNFDQKFEMLLQKNTAERKITTSVRICDGPQGFDLSITDQSGNQATMNVEYKKELAKSSQTANIVRNMSKMGDTIFSVEDVEVDFAEDYFIPSSVLSDWRRQLANRLLELRKANHKQETFPIEKTTHAFPKLDITYLGNVMNNESKKFYVQHQANVSQWAFEKEVQADAPLMFTRHCIKYSLGYCPTETKKQHPYKEPFFLVHRDTRLRLEFDCKQCEMKVFAV